MKDYKNRKLQQNYKQNGKLRIQKTLNRFQNQFSDRKYFSKSGKKFQRQHQNNAARVCSRLRVLTQNQVGFSKRFFNSDLLLAVSSTNQRQFKTLISKFQHYELLQECLKTPDIYENFHILPIFYLKLFVSEIKWYLKSWVHLRIFGYLTFSCLSADYFHWFNPRLNSERFFIF